MTTRTLIAVSNALPTGTLTPGTPLSLSWTTDPGATGVNIENGNLKLDPRVNPVSATTYAYYVTIQTGTNIIAQAVVLPQNDINITRKSGQNIPLLGIIVNNPSPTDPEYGVSIYTTQVVTGVFPANTRVHLFRLDIAALSATPSDPGQEDDIPGIKNLSLRMVKKHLRLDPNSTTMDDLLIFYVNTSAAHIDSLCRSGLIRTPFS